MSKKHCFQLVSEFSFSHFLIFSNQMGAPHRFWVLSLQDQKPNWRVGFWMLRKWGVSSPPTLRYQIRVQTGTCLLPILPYLLLPGIQWYQWPITAQISCTCAQGSAISLATFVFNSQEPWVIVLDCTEKPGGKGIPYLWLEYCLGKPKQTFSPPGVNKVSLT